MVQWNLLFLPPFIVINLKFLSLCGPLDPYEVERRWFLESPEVRDSVRVEESRFLFTPIMCVYLRDPGSSHPRRVSID